MRTLTQPPSPTPYHPPPLWSVRALPVTGSGSRPLRTRAAVPQLDGMAATATTEGGSTQATPSRPTVVTTTTITEVISPARWQLCSPPLHRCHRRLLHLLLPCQGRRIWAWVRCIHPTSAILTRSDRSLVCWLLLPASLSISVLCTTPTPHTRRTRCRELNPSWAPSACSWGATLHSIASSRSKAGRPLTTPSRCPRQSLSR